MPMVDVEKGSLRTGLRFFVSVMTVCLILLYGSSVMATDKDCSFSMRVTQSPPRFYLENDRWKGLQVELTSVLVEETGCSLNFMELPWKRALVMLQNGTVDIVSEMSITPEREKYAYFVGPALAETIVIVVKAESDFQINSLEDLKKIPGRLGVGLGSWHGDEFTAMVVSDAAFEKKIEYVVSDYIQLERVLAGRIWGYVTMKSPALYRIEHDPVLKDKLKIHDFVIYESKNYWGLSRKGLSRQEIDKVEKAFDRLKEDGTLEVIRQKYNRSDH